MKPIRTSEKLPSDDCNVWWYSYSNTSWILGTSIFMNFEGNPELYNEYTYWLPEEALPIIDIFEYYIKEE